MSIRAAPLQLDGVIAPGEYDDVSQLDDFSELIEKLAALVPPPRLNLVRYHGVLAPNAGFRRLVVPSWSCCRTLHRWGSLRFPPLVVA